MSIIMSITIQFIYIKFNISVIFGVEYYLHRTLETIIETTWNNLTAHNWQKWKKKVYSYVPAKNYTK